MKREFRVARPSTLTDLGIESKVGKSDDGGRDVENLNSIKH